MKILLNSLPSVLLGLRVCASSTPAASLSDIPHFFADAVVDHFSAAPSPPTSASTWTQRYYTLPDHFLGPGSPIFLVLGGEGTLMGLTYPFVNDVLAPQFGAYVLQPEHRFYGSSHPVYPDDGTRSAGDMARLLTAEQAMLDAVALLTHIRGALGCDALRGSAGYCPAVAVGGSYPGFLAAMMRARYPAVVDAAYAASAPMKFYAQQLAGHEYFDRISAVAEDADAGCAAAVRSTLDAVAADLEDGGPGHYRTAAERLGLCPALPGYIADGDTFRDEILMVVASTFADHNMAYYPPRNKTELCRSCRLFRSDPGGDGSRPPHYARLRAFLSASVRPAPPPGSCFDLSAQLPAGPNATITSGDWSGVGTGPDGESWDFQTCTELVERIGFSDGSMFPPREWTYEWLRGHCARRFGVEPRPNDLVLRWGLRDLAGSGASRIIFTNGLNDGWSVGGFMEDPGPDLLVVNFTDGAHHSDLRGEDEQDSEDMQKGRMRVRNLLAGWLGFGLGKEGRDGLGSKDRGVSLRIVR